MVVVTNKSMEGENKSFSGKKEANATIFAPFEMQEYF